MAKGTIPGTVRVDHSSVTGPTGGVAEGKDSPARAGLAWERQIVGVTKCRDVYGGTPTMIAAGTRYLRQFPKEEDEQYAERLAAAKLYNMFRKTVDGFAGLVWRKPLEYSDDMPPAIYEQLQNVDLAGRTLDEMARDEFKDKYVAGHGHVFVDWHSPTQDPQTALAEAGARPFWTTIRKEQVLRFHPENVDGRILLTRFAYLSEYVAPDGEFGEVAMWRVREYVLLPAEGLPPGEGRVQYRSWTRPADAGAQTAWAPEEAGRSLGPRMMHIPLVTDYASRIGFMESEPTLLDLADENIEHYQVRSERRQTLGIAGIPIMLFTGADAEEIQTLAVGPAIGINLPEGATGQYLETEGRALEQQRQELQDIEQRCAALGLSALQRQTRSAETAEAHRQDVAVQHSELGWQAIATTAMLNEALALHAEWMGLDPKAVGTVALAPDFDPQPLTPQMVQILAGMVGEDLLSLDTLWDMLVEGDVLPETFDPVEERKRLEKAVEERMNRAERMGLGLGQPLAGEDEEGDEDKGGGEKPGEDVGDEEGEAA